MAWNGSGWNPCLSNAGLLNKMINSVLAEIDDNSYASYFDNSITIQKNNAINASSGPTRISFPHGAGKCPM